MPSNFLDQLLANPHGLGYGPAYPTAPVITYDEYGQPHDPEGNKIQPPADPSLADSLWNIGESPARVATAFAGALSPYGQEGWQVPPAIHEPINALMRLGQNSRFDDGRLGIPNPQNLDNQHDTATLIETLFGGNAMNPAVRVPEGALASNALKATERPQGFDVWHGSPHDFDKFDLSKIGTGEGAQAYGHGLYFAENPGIAKSYRDNIASDATSFTFPTREEAIAAAGPKGDIAQQPNGGFMAMGADGNIVRANPGYLYQARINADPEHFLDWDKPLSDQPENIRALAKSMFPDVDESALNGVSGNDLVAGIGAHLRKTAASPDPYSDNTFNSLLGSLNRPDLASSALKDAGVPGIRYLDGGSRAAGDGSRNYVVFDHNLVDTLHKWRGDQQLYSGGGPSLWGNALSQDQNDKRNSFFNY